MAGKMILGTILALAVLGCAAPSSPALRRFDALVGKSMDSVPAEWGPATRTVDMPDGHVSYVWDLGAREEDQELLDPKDTDQPKVPKYFTGISHSFVQEDHGRDCLWILEVDQAGVIVKIAHEGRGCH
jgi:hypothetical protein